MCNRCNAAQNSLMTAQQMVRRKLREKDESQRTRAPRTLLYGIFSDQFVLLGKRYCWVNENGVLSLVRVTWSEDDEEESVHVDD
jgi:hypothetical protein